MDQQKLRSLVFDKTGVRIDVDDPIFALVALNEAVLEEAVGRHVALLDEATEALAEQAQLLQEGGAGCRFVAAGGTRTVPAARPAVSGGQGSTSPGLSDRRALALAAGTAALTALFVLAGQAIFFKPAAGLTPAQSASIHDGEKLAGIVQKLDPKTRALIDAEMQKP
ncbi:hypothetical protein [Massilia glaciei]|uniref:Uncharacterized protein n=1 Tax=Massilia glaciei TaxID=1524097 RepID=A0A2U2I5Q9_9BURK|nr:hypothetical protein [Massilia glaciei]PWF55098.1 hypothetical protein C7C56_003535 [Massilia glaciei]